MPSDNIKIHGSQKADDAINYVTTCNPAKTRKNALVIIHGASRSASEARVVLTASAMPRAWIHTIIEQAENKSRWLGQARLPSASLPRSGRAADAFIGKAERRHVLGAIDIAQIDNDRLRHLAL
jgi:hypothetical protein